MKSWKRTAFAVMALLVSSSAIADCIEPPGLSFQQWYQHCTADIQDAYRVYGIPMGLTFEQYVVALYRFYVQSNSGALPPAPMVPCQQAGATYCPASGWLLTCNGQWWLTGAQRC
jgi:hypothetical protein